MSQFRLLKFTRPKTSAAPAVPLPHDRRVIAMDRKPFIIVHARPPQWPDCVIGPPRHGDNRTPGERWEQFCFEWETHFYG